MERWLPALGYPGYEVSDGGHVRSLSRTDTLGRGVSARILVNARMQGRYLTIRLRRGNLTVAKAVHLMVLEAFIGPRPAGLQACHNNGDRTDNRLGNLRWDTSTANQRDKIAHGTIARGERNGAHELTESRVRFVKVMYALGVTSPILAAAFGISEMGIQRVCAGVVWGWVVAPEPSTDDRRVAGILITAVRRRKAALQRKAKAKPGSKRERLGYYANVDAVVEAAEAAYQEAIAVACTWADANR